MYKNYLYANHKSVISHLSNLVDDYEQVADPFDIFNMDSRNTILLILHRESYSDDDLYELINDTKNIQHIKILLLTNKLNLIDGAKFLKLGVTGYGNVYMHPAILNQAVEVIKSGNVWIYPELAQHLIKNLKENDNKKKVNTIPLTASQNECVSLIVKGYSNKEIAHILNVAEITVKKNLSSIYKRLSIKNRMELAFMYK